MLKKFYYVEKTSKNEEENVYRLFNNSDDLWDERVSDYYETIEEAIAAAEKLEIPKIDEWEYDSYNGWYNRTFWEICSKEVEMDDFQPEFETLEKFIDNNGDWEAEKDWSDFECYVEINDKYVQFGEYEEAEKFVEIINDELEYRNVGLSEIYSGNSDEAKISSYCYKKMTELVSKEEMTKMVFEDLKKFVDDEEEKDVTTEINERVFGYEENHENVNSFLKAMVLDFGEKRVIVKNDNFGTNKKYASFENGKKEAGLNPLQIVFSGVEIEKLVHSKYINANDEVCEF